MICDCLENLPRYHGMLPALDAVIDFTAKHDVNALPMGRTDIDGEHVFVNVQEFDLLPANKWESHARYADLQLSLSGGETIGYLPVDTLPDWQTWNGDIRFNDDAGTGIPLQLDAGMFALLFPWDAHKPCLGTGHGKKAVFKLEV